MEPVTFLTNLDEERITAGLKAPQIETAEVGQTIIVKAVDEGGKPTEWEAANLPSCAEWAKQPEKPKYTAEEVGAMGVDENGWAESVSVSILGVYDKDPNNGFIMSWENNEDEYAVAALWGRTDDAPVRIRNIAPASEDNDAVTLGQLNDKLAEQNIPEGGELIFPADYEKIAYGTLAEAAGLAISADMNGNPFSLKKAVLVLEGGYTNATSSNTIFYNQTKGAYQLDIGGLSGVNRTVIELEMGSLKRATTYKGIEVVKTYKDARLSDNGEFLYPITEPISKIWSTNWTGGAVPDAGTIYSLWGVRV